MNNLIKRSSLALIATSLLGAFAYADAAKDSPSIITITCKTCPELTLKADEPIYVPPKVNLGETKETLTTVDGKNVMIRADAMLGGTAIQYITTTPTWMPQEALVEDVNTPAIDDASTSSTN